MRVCLTRLPADASERGRKIFDDIFGDLDIENTMADGWFDPTMIMVITDVECSDGSEGDVLMFNSVTGKLNMWLQRRECYAELEGKWGMALIPGEGVPDRS